MLKPVSYLELAKEAKSRGDERAYHRAIKQNKRLQHKKTQRLLEQLGRAVK